MAENSKSNRDVKFFQKLKCGYCEGKGELRWNTKGQMSKCNVCQGSGITAGTDITSIIKPIFQFIINIEWVLCNCVAKKVKDYQNRKLVKYGDYNHNTESCLFEKAKQIIEENTIKVE